MQQEVRMCDIVYWISSHIDLFLTLPAEEELWGQEQV